MQTILVISFSDLASDPRVNRQLRWLAGCYRVIAAGLADPGINGVRFLALDRSPAPVGRKLAGALALICRCYKRYYWNRRIIRAALDKLSGVRAQLIIANDLVALPLALRLAAAAPVLFDAHEYAPGEFDDLWLWRLLFRPYATSFCRRFIPQVGAMTTVCQGIAAAYEQLTGVAPVVLTNAAEFYDLEPRPTSEGGRPIRLIHHGAAIRSRRLEAMIEMMDHLDDRFELNLMLVDGPRPSYRRWLEGRARARPSVRFLPPVPMRQLVAFLNQFDIGVFLLEPVNFNYRYCLPNKFFEYIQARLGVVVGPSPEMARIVTAAGCGVVAADFRPQSLAAALTKLTAGDINRFKARSHAVAWQSSAQSNRQIFLELVERLLAGRPAAEVSLT